MDEKTTRMLFATLALSALAALLAGPANAYIAPGDGVNAVSSHSQQRQQSQVPGPGTIPYLSQGIGVDKSQFSGVPRTAESRQAVSVAPKTTIPYLSQGIGVDKSQFDGPQAARPLPGPHGALQLRNERTPVAPLPHGIQVVLSQPGEQPLGLTGDSPLTRVSAPEPEGLTGDSAATRYPGTASLASTGTVSSGNDFDWTSFGAGAGMVALVAAALGGALLTARKRHSVGLP